MEKKNLYLELKERQQNELNNLPIYWAFGQSQIDELVQKLGFKTEDDLLKNVFTIGAGSIILKKDKELVLDTFKRHEKELNDNMLNDDFLQSAFEYELANHEYIITYDLDETLRALGIKKDEFYNDDRLKNIMSLAITNYKRDMELMGW